MARNTARHRIVTSQIGIKRGALGLNCAYNSKELCRFVLRRPRGVCVLMGTLCVTALCIAQAVRDRAEPEGN